MHKASPVLLLVLLTPWLEGQEKKSNPQTPMPAIDPNSISDAKAAQSAADVLEAAYAGKEQPEGVRMLIAILRGSRMGPGDGWFGPCQTRYTWEWLAKLHGVELDKGISRKAFRGSDVLFNILDKNGDGEITSADLRGPEAAKTPKSAPPANPPAGMDAMRPVLIRGLFAGEIGSINEGPAVGQAAPNFALRTIDGAKRVQLSDLLGKKPVVLVFGNFTCGPFCNTYPGVEPIAKRFADDATFLMVYVREAHPIEGWHMGKGVNQPKTYEERVKLAQQFVNLAKPALPVLVDEINDPVGHAYSGMPARLYVIDASGTVAYKSGRGPFGFRPNEMEQALAMTLLDSAKEKR